MSNLYMDPTELRRIAERILGNREYDYRPKLDEVREDIQPGQGTLAGVDDAPREGYVYGRSGIGSFHDECVKEVVRLFEDLDLGLVAISNVLASVAENYNETDGAAATDLAATLEYFTPHRELQH